MKKLIVFIILLASLTQAQGVMLLFGSDGTASIDTIPSQFTFTDVTDAAVSSYNQGYIVVAGCDSARFYTNGTDSLKLGALGAYDVDPIWADVGDSVYMGNVASASNSTATHKILYSANGTPLDTFSVTTVAASGFDPSDLSPIVDLRYGVGMTADGTSGNITQWTDGTYAFANADTASAPQDFGDKLFFVTGGTRYLSRADDNVLDLTEAQDFTIEIWASITGVGRIFHNRGSAPYWQIIGADNDGAKFRLTLHNGTTVAEITADTVAITNGWHHFVVSVDWGVGADLYIDGELKGSEHTTEWTEFTTAGQGITYIGRSDNPEGFGYVSDIRLYHSALSSTDVDDLFAFGRTQ